MTKDYAHRKRKKYPKSWSKSPRQSTGIIRRFLKRLLLLIVLIALLVFVGVQIIKYKQQILKHFSFHSANQVAKTVQTTESQKGEKPKVKESPLENEVSFEFYRMLPKMSVEVYNEQDPSVKREIEKSDLYVLQLASVKNEEDANLFRQRLVELGYKPHIVIINRGEVTWYRVQIGPYNDIAVAENDSNQLLKHNISSILLKLTKNPQPQDQSDEK